MEGIRTVKILLHQKRDLVLLQKKQAIETENSSRSVITLTFRKEINRKKQVLFLLSQEKE